VKEKLSLTRSTGSVRLDGCDASEIFIKTNTGSVTGTLLSEKTFFAKSDTARYGVCTSMTNPNYVPLYHSCSYGTPKERGGEK
jgi:hypothetical protein